MIPNPQPPEFTDYQSPPGARQRVLLPTQAFYRRVAVIVIGASIRARRGGFGDEDFYQSSLAVRSAFEKAGAHVSIAGTANLAALDRPCVIIGNHMSTAETFLLPGILMPIRPITFVVKQALLDYPVFKHIMRARNPIVVGRVNPREDLRAVMEGGAQHLAEGRSVVIFPQRTRTVEFDPEAFNSIGVKLAKRTGAPVVPFALRTDAWSNGKWIKEFGRFYPDRPVHFDFGKPFEVGSTDKEAHAKVIEFIQSRLAVYYNSVTKGN